jgi:hypothetical protein
MTDFFRHNIQHPKLLGLFDLWTKGREDGRPMPRQSAFQSSLLVPWASNLVIIRVQERKNFTYGFYGVDLKAAFGVDMTGHPVEMLPLEQAATVRAEYRETVNSMKPQWRVYSAWFDEEHQTWERLILPLGNQTGRVGLILVGVYRLS